MTNQLLAKLRLKLTRASEFIILQAIEIIVPLCQLKI